MLSRYLHHIDSINPTRWLNKTVVELGAGTGVVACALGVLGVPGLQIWSTDLQELLPLARQNVALNGLEQNVHVTKLSWQVDIHHLYLSKARVALIPMARGQALPNDVPHQPDVLLLADCIYVRQILCNRLSIVSHLNE